jgi:DNA-binding response OmpR family regulator
MRGAAPAGANSPLGMCYRGYEAVRGTSQYTETTMLGSGGGHDMPQIIMLVDDELDILDILSQVLEGEGYTVVAFGDGRAALDYARLQPPALALIDLLMPRMDGYELITRLRGEANARFPIVVMSASSNYEHVRSLPIQDYIAKPFDLDDLLARVRSQLKESAASVPLRVADVPAE